VWEPLGAGFDDVVRRLSAWNGDLIAGGSSYRETNSATLVIDGVQIADGGPYNVVVSSAGGGVAST
jgi:hypothetical protein